MCIVKMLQLETEYTTLAWLHNESDRETRTNKTDT